MNMGYICWYKAKERKKRKDPSGITDFDFIKENKRAT